MVVLADLYPNRYRSKAGIGRLFACAGVQGRLNSNVVTGGIAKETVAKVVPDWGKGLERDPRHQKMLTAGLLWLSLE